MFWAAHRDAFCESRRGESARTESERGICSFESFVAGALVTRRRLPKARAVRDLDLCMPPSGGGGGDDCAPSSGGGSGDCVKSDAVISEFMAGNIMVARVRTSGTL